MTDFFLLQDNGMYTVVRVGGVFRVDNSAISINPPTGTGRVVWRKRLKGEIVQNVTITDNMGAEHTGKLNTIGYEMVPYCSVCGGELGVSSLAFCPNCGNKMDGGYNR